MADRVYKGITPVSKIIFVIICAIFVPHLFVYLTRPAAHEKRTVLHTDSCNHGYSFLKALSTVKPFDVGIGTDKAYQCIMLPETIDISHQRWLQLSALLKDQGVEGTPYHYMNTHKGIAYHGLSVCVDDTPDSSYQILRTILEFFKANNVAMSCTPQENSILHTMVVREYVRG